MFRQMAEFHPFFYPFQLAPVVAQDICCGLVEVRFPVLLLHGGSSDHANVSLLQDFVRRSGVTAETAEITVERASGAQIKSLEFALAGPLVDARFSHSQATCDCGDEQKLLLLLQADFLYQEIRR